MIPVNAIFGLIEASLKLWNTKESKEYLDRVYKLKKDFYEEYNKPDYVRDYALLDNISNELRIISEAIATTAQVKNS